MKYIIVFLYITLVLSGCKKKTAGNCGDADLNCAGIACLIINYNFDFRLIDKTTGADLVFGPSPRYIPGDIKLYSDAAKQRPVFVITDNSSKLFVVTQARPEMYLEVAGTTTYKILASFKKVDCCTERIKDLSMDNQSVCTCCNAVIELKVN